MLTDKKISFRVLSVLKLSWESGEAYAEKRPYNALSLRLEGDSEFIHNGKSVRATAGDILFVPAGTDYKLISHKRESLIVVHFDILYGEADGFEVFKPANPEIMTDLFVKMYHTWRASAVGYEYRVESTLARVLEGIVSENFNRKRGIKPDFSTLLGFIHSNFTDPALTVDSMARRMGISTTYLRELFSENLGTTPLKYLHSLRIDYADRLLESDYYTVEEVARLSGYNDPKYFSTAYKRERGNPPSKSRRLLKNT